MKKISILGWYERYDFSNLGVSPEIRNLNPPDKKFWVFFSKYPSSQKIFQTFAKNCKSNKIFHQRVLQIKLLGLLIFYHAFGVSCPCIKKSVVQHVVFFVIVAKCDLFVYIAGHFENICSNFGAWYAPAVHGEYFLVVTCWVMAAGYYRAANSHKNIRKVGEYR